MPGQKVKVRRRLKDGSIRVYEYDRLREKDAPVSGTIRHVLSEFKLSQGFKRLSPATRAYYENGWAFLQNAADTQLSDWRRKTVLALRDHASRHGTGTANMALAALSVLCTYAVEREIIEFNPCMGVPKFPQKEGSPWSNAQVEYWLQNAREPMRRAVLLAVSLGQRRGDILSLTWSQWTGDWIELTQGKTGVELAIPVDPMLKAELEAWRKTATAVTILTNARGRPWNAKIFTTQFCKERIRLGLTEGTFHGLRHTRLTQLAEEGASTHDIASISGHKQLSMIERYTRKASQKRRAARAMGLVKSFAPKATK